MINIIILYHRIGDTKNVGKTTFFFAIFLHIILPFTFFTKIDTDIEKRIQKDPLGQQVIWTRYASKLYDKVNSITTEINGYILTALGLDIMEKYMQKNDLTKTERRDIQVIYEMLVIYILVEAIVEKNDDSLNDIGFIGKENGKRIYKQKARIIDRKSNDVDERQILVSQEHQGIIARYRSKVEKIGKENILNIVFKEREKIEKIEKYFLEIFNNKDKKIRFNKCFNDQEIDVKKEIIDTIKNAKNDKVKWLEILEINTDGREELLRIMQENEELQTKELVEKFLADKNVNDEIKQKLEKIKAVENYLVLVSNIFYEIMKNEKLELKNKEMLERLREAHKQVKEENLYEVISSSINKSDEELMKAIIRQHEKLQKDLNKKPWMELKDNELIINHKVEKDINEGWEHGYYIDVVKHLASSLENSVEG